VDKHPLVFAVLYTSRVAGRQGGRVSGRVAGRQAGWQAGRVSGCQVELSSADLTEQTCSISMKLLVNTPSALPALLLLSLLWSLSLLWAQVVAVAVAGVCSSRRATYASHSECAGSPTSAPAGTAAAEEKV
jgi:hypothetical protein